MTEECKQLQSIKKKGGTSAFKGKHHTDESKQKISENSAHRGKPGTRLGAITSEETKKKQSEAKKGKIPWNKGKKK